MSAKRRARRSAQRPGAEPRALASDDEARLLGDWALLNRDLLSLPEEAVRQLLTRAVKERRRRAVTLRIYARFSRLRLIRERRALLEHNRLPCS